jgi:hypothetical protein
MQACFIDSAGDNMNLTTDEQMKIALAARKLTHPPKSLDELTEMLLDSIKKDIELYGRLVELAEPQRMSSTSGTVAILCSKCKRELGLREVD